MNLIKRLRLKQIIRWILIFSISSSAFSQILEINTRYFRIMYHEEKVEFASWLYHNADRIFEEKAKLMHLEKPTKRIGIFLPEGLSRSAEVGFYRNNLITLYPNHILSFYNSNNYLETVFTHELIHIIINRKGPVTLGIGPLFSALIPAWLHEGAAVLEERSRGYTNNFVNVNKSFTNLNLGSANYAPYLCYNLGFSILDFIKKELGEEKYYKLFSNRARSISLQTLPFFGGLELMKKWSKDNPKGKIIGIKYSNERAHFLTSHGNKLLYRSLTHENVFKRRRENIKLITIENNNNISEKYLTRNGASFLSLYEDDILEIRNFIEQGLSPVINAAAYINSSFIDIKNPTILVKRDDDIFYAQTIRAKDRVVSKKHGTLIDENEDMIIKKILPYKDRLFILASDYYEGATHIFEVKSDKFIKIAKSYDASINEDKIYFSQDIEDEVGLFEYDIATDKIYILEKSNTIESPNRVKDRIFFLQWNEGARNLYYLNYRDLERKEHSFKKEYIERESRKNKRIEDRKKLEIRGQRYSAHFYPRMPRVSINAQGLKIGHPIVSDLDRITINQGIVVPFSDEYPYFNLNFAAGPFISNFDIMPMHGKINISRLGISYQSFIKQIKLLNRNSVFVNNIAYDFNKLQGFPGDFIRAVDNGRTHLEIHSQLSFDHWTFLVSFAGINNIRTGQFNRVLRLFAEIEEFRITLVRTYLNRATEDISDILRNRFSLHIASNEGFIENRKRIFVKSKAPLIIAQKTFRFGIPLDLSSYGEAHLALNRLEFAITGFTIFADTPTLAARGDCNLRIVHYNRFSSDIVASILYISSEVEYSIGFRFNFSASD